MAQEGKTTADFLREAMDEQGVKDNVIRAGLAAIAMGESKMQGHVETGYSRTPNSRIRQVFGSRVENLSDDELNALKASDREWFNFIYGSQFSTGRQLGNTQPNDGYDFRGRGFIQLTGRANYTRYANKIGRPDIVSNPELANDPELSAKLSVAYILDRYHGGGFEKLMACVGNNTPDIAQTKRQYFQQFTASGEFNADGTSGAAQDQTLTQRVMQFQQTWNLAHPRQPKLAVDGIPGPKTRAAGWSE